MRVGKRFPLEDINDHFSFQGGASLSYNSDSKSLTLYISIPDITEKEVEAVSSGDLRFFFYENKELDTHLTILEIDGVLEVDIIFDINVLGDADGLLEGNGLHIFFIDQRTKILKAMRVLGLGDKFMSMMKSITINDGRYTTQEYMKWIKSTFNFTL